MLKQKKPWSIVLASASIVALAASPTVTTAQVVSDNPGEQVDEGLDTIIVTARRRTETLQDVPGSVTAIRADVLDSFNATEIGDIQSSVPNVVLHEGDAQNTVAYIRGVGQLDSLAFADPGVGIYLDDVYLGRAQGSFLDVFDVERIEVLRGPQGTLYGRNTIGGAIKFVSRRPTPDPELKAKASVGSFDQRELKVGLSGPIAGDRLLGKAAIAALKRDGYSTNSVDGLSDGDRDTLVWRGSVLANITDAFEVLLSVDGSNDTPSRSRTPVRETSVFGAFEPNSDPSEIDANFNELSDLSVFGVSSHVTWALSDQLSLNSITSYRKMGYDANLDLDATAAAFFGVFVFQDQNQFSQELQLNYTGDRWSLVSGLYYFEEDDITESGIFGPDIAFISNSINDQTTTAYAAYADASVDITDRLSVSVGLRLTEEEKEFARVQEFFAATTPLVPVISQGARVTDVETSETFSNTSPKVSIQYDISDNVTGYGTIARGFKSGGFDGRSNSGFEAQPFEAETLTAYEAGLKGTFLNNRITLNAAMFLNEYEDLQVSSFTESNGSFAAIFTNAAEATIAGFELEGSWLATPSLRFDYALGYLDAEYDLFIGENGEDVSNQLRPANAPDWTGRLAAEYTAEITPSIDLVLNAAASYRGEVFPTVSSSQVLRQAGYTLYDASARFEFSDGKYALSLVGKNLSDKIYRTQGFDLSDSLGYQLGYYGAPRTFTLSASVTY